MTTRIALLRAINIGGRSTVAMADLRQMFADFGYEDTRTVLQTGNVVFRSSKGGGKLETILEQAFADRLELKTDVFLRDLREWEQIIADNPFSDVATQDPSHLVLMPLKKKVSGKIVDALRAAIKGREQVEAVGSQLYIIYPDGIGRSKLTNAMIEKTLQTRGTGRNWNSVLKIAEAAKKS